MKTTIIGTAETKVFPALFKDNEGDIWIVNDDGHGMVIAGSEHAIGCHDQINMDIESYGLKRFTGTVTITA